LLGAVDFLAVRAFGFALLAVALLTDDLLAFAVEAEDAGFADAVFGFALVVLAFARLAAVELFGFAAAFFALVLTVLAVGRFTVRARRDRRVRSGLFQLTARSARNEAGIVLMRSSSSVTASAAASDRSARMSEMTVAGRFTRAACTRFVRRMTNMLRCGSIHIEVPV
jgi:hypothetical protein